MLNIIYYFICYKIWGLITKKNEKQNNNNNHIFTA